MWVAPNTIKAYPKGKQDNTHYNIYGATLVSKLIIKQVKRQVPALKKYIK
jgi:pectinesterase